MKEKLPQEIEVWDILPAIRKAFAKIFVEDFKLSQKKTAELLQLTEPAVSPPVISRLTRRPFRKPKSRP